MTRQIPLPEFAHWGFFIQPFCWYYLFYCFSIEKQFQNSLWEMRHRTSFCKKKLFDCTWGMWKFPGQGLFPCYSSNQNRCFDNAGSLTRCATRELQNKFVCLFLFFVFCFFFFSLSLFRVASVAYVNSQVRSQIGAIAAGLPHSPSNARSEAHLRHTLQLRILNPLSGARDWTCILMDTSWVLNLLGQWELLEQVLVREKAGGISNMLELVLSGL